MKKLLFFVIIVAAAYFAWARFGPSRAPPTGSADTTPAANATQRIDNLSGAAPQEH
jgi:hypothetical protein